MGSSPSRLTPLQRDLLDAFSAREQRFALTGGAALAGFYFGHRTTNDLDFFAASGVEIEEGARTLGEAASACRATAEAVKRSPTFASQRGSRRGTMHRRSRHRPNATRRPRRASTRLDSRGYAARDRGK